MLRPALSFLILIISFPTILSQNYAAAHGPHPDEYYCELFGDQHVMCEFFEINRLCMPYQLWPREHLKSIIGEGILLKHRDEYAHQARGADLGLKKEEYEIPNMNLLVWDDELAAFAERYVFQCPRQTYPFNDVERFRVAQFLLESVHPGRFDDITTLLVRQLLFDPELEIHEFHVLREGKNGYELASNYNPNFPMSLITNPYFKYYGCAFAKMKQVIDIPGYKYFKILLVCNFGPLTDDSLKEVQPRGKACSQCPNGTRCIRKSMTPFQCQESLEPDEETEAPTTVEETTVAIDITTLTNETQSNNTEEYNTPTEEIESPQPPETTRAESQTISECLITCGNGMPHVRCAFSEPSYDFGEVVMLNGREVRDSILVMHNSIRNVVARGVQGFPMAGNMRELQWNSKLEMSAVAWASQCKPYKYDCQDYLEGSNSLTRVTQLVAPFIWDLKTGLPQYTQAVQNWLLGVNSFHEELLNSYLSPSNGEDYENFAQLIWANTYMVGCGVALCHEKIEGSNQNGTDLDYNEDLDAGETLIVTICNYAPGGLLDGKAIYLVGGPCSLCTRLHKNNTGGMYCSKEYIGLCSSATRTNAVMAALSVCLGILLITVPEQ